MTTLYHEILGRFPEARSCLDDADEEPFLLLGYLADWLKGLSAEDLTPDLVDRVVAFAQWCEMQPRGDDSRDDLWSIYVVAFFEALFFCETTRALIPRLVSREDLIANADYMRTWVGADNYNAALRYYEEG